MPVWRAYGRFGVYSGVIMTEKTYQDLRNDLFGVDRFPLSAHDTLIVEGLLRDLLAYHQEVCNQKMWTNTWVVGLMAAISYFETMGNFKAEQEHQDAFCTPIIEGS